MKDILFSLNPWWRTSEILDLPDVERSELSEIIAEVDNLRRATIVTGPRRTGKSTLLLQMIRHLLKRGVNAKRICFFDCIEPGLTGVELKTIWQEYFTGIIGEAPEGFTETVYMFIDEIHFSADWQLYLKSFIDKRYKIKFVVSGSSAAALFLNAKDSLMGRTHTVRVLPMDFRQFLLLKKSFFNEQAMIIDNITCEVDWFDIAEVQKFAVAFDTQYYAPFALMLLNEYFAAGGYPEYFQQKSLLGWQRFLTEDIIDYGLYRDIVGFYKVRQPELLKKIMFYIAANQGAALPIVTLAQAVSADRVTVNEYIELLVDATLVNVVGNFSENRGKILRKNKKYYISDCGVRNALLKRRVFLPEEEGLLAETTAFAALRRKVAAEFGDVYYFRENANEIDFIADINKERIPVEVKFRNSVTASDYQTLSKYIADVGAKSGMVITKSKLQVKDGVVLFPLWLI